MGQSHPLNDPTATSTQDDQRRRRRRAHGQVHAELAAAAPGESAVAVHDYGPGCLAVGAAGPVDRAAAERLGGLLREVRGRSTRELLLSFALLGPWHPHLVRVLGQVRIHHLIDGGRVELHDAPPALSLELDLAGWVQPSRPPRP